MIIRLLRRIKFFTSIMLPLICLTGCQEEDNSEYRDSIVGEWFYDISDNNQTVLGTEEFTSDGKFKEWSTIIGPAYYVNQTVEGRYTCDENIKIVYSTKYEPTQFVDIIRINSIDHYNFNVYIETASAYRSFHRIIDTYSMNVGESRACNINDAAFNATGYISCDEKIASVDNSGNIRALKRGTTFIRMISSIGEAVIRVTVTDPDNVIDDYLKYINSPIDQVIKDFGNNYTEYNEKDGTTQLMYNTLDDITRRLFFSYILKDKVCMIEQKIKDDADMSAIIESFDKKYELSDENESYRSYLCYMDDYIISIKVYSQQLTITYALYLYDIEKFDGMITVNIDNFAKWFNYDLSTSQYNSSNNTCYFSKFIDNIIYKAIIIEYNNTTRDISLLRLVLRSETIDVAKVEDWFTSHYYVYNTMNNGKWFHPLKSFPRSEYYVFFAETGNGTEIIYAKR